MRMQQVKASRGLMVISAWADPTGSTVNYRAGFMWAEHLGGPTWHPVETYPRDGLSLVDALRRDWADAGEVTVICAG